ncbi:uncharacterized protein LOC109721303 [Ananas comosus]|uniref:Dual-specificity RNA methyltransferase RlmN 1 n=1 Tax=Ananas comosus TaxID=4615 RepID=A0A199V450_ANACO|nr:uncharacterized protein LOC109721303 [Ananas comosus]OAY71844.1 Dual-specificity RNA methyltransferase RlmN 1 [Ananas comosus]
MAMRSVFDGGALRTEFESAGISIHFIPLIWKHVLQNPGCDLDSVPSLPSAAYPLLRSKFRAMTSSLAAAVDSKDRDTTKLLIRLQNGAFVEAVIMRYDTRLGKYNGNPRPGGVRSTLCVSSQVGCKMGCKFCATGTMGFKNNLSTGEIVEQLVHAQQFSRIRNVVFMGMGEPLNNYKALVEAVEIMTGLPFQLSPKKITVSTVGIIHAINKLHDDLPNVNLAVSIHAPDQDIRCQIMPAARAFPLGKLMDALQTYQNNSKQTIFIEYIMLDGINDQEQHAHQLGKLLETLKAVVNLIPFNPIGISSCFRTSSEQNVKRFQKILRGVYNIRTTVRQQMGQDISGACGQLVVNLSEQRSAGGASLLTDIEDLRI